MKLKKGFYEASGMSESDMQNRHTLIVEELAGGKSLENFDRVICTFSDDTEETRAMAHEIICAVNLREDSIKALEAAVLTLESNADHDKGCAMNGEEEMAMGYGCTCGLYNQIGQTKNLITMLKSKMP